MLKADVYGEEAEYFLNSISPETLLADSALRENIETKFEKLLDSSYNPCDQKAASLMPTIELCVYSFNGGTSQTHFRVFGTSLIWVAISLFLLIISFDFIIGGKSGWG